MLVDIDPEDDDAVLGNPLELEELELELALGVDGEVDVEAPLPPLPLPEESSSTTTSPPQAATAKAEVTEPMSARRAKECMGTPQGTRSPPGRGAAR
ncbi:MAG: hypothetical protein WKG00_00210 [Polyangiaceae bacterium]